MAMCGTKPTKTQGAPAGPETNQRVRQKEKEELHYQLMISTYNLSKMMKDTTMTELVNADARIAELAKSSSMPAK